MYEVLLIIFLIIDIALIALIILQQGRSADISSSFKTGASNTLFGSSGSANFMTRTTAIFATLFFIISLLLSNINNNKTNKNENKWENKSLLARTESSKTITSTTPSNDILQ